MFCYLSFIKGWIVNLIGISIFQVLNAAWDVGIPVASENALPCHDRDGYNKILENAKPLSDPDGRHLSAFTYLRLSPALIEKHNFSEFERFVKRMHGKHWESMVDNFLNKFVIIKALSQLLNSAI